LTPILKAAFGGVVKDLPTEHVLVTKARKADDDRRKSDEEMGLRCERVRQDIELQRVSELREAILEARAVFTNEGDPCEIVPDAVHAG
jgi:hypothetical protein